MTPFNHAKETWVQRVIADGMASWSRFFDIGQDSLGGCALEDSPSCYGAVALTAENISILVELLRQRDGWTATLTTLVMHDAVSRIVATHKWDNNPEEGSFALMPVLLCSTWKEPRTAYP